MPLAAALEGPAKVSTLLIHLLTCSGIFSCQGYEETDGRKYLLPIILLYYYYYHHYIIIIIIIILLLLCKAVRHRYWYCVWCVWYSNTKGSSSSVGSRTPRETGSYLAWAWSREMSVCSKFKRIKKGDSLWNEYRCNNVIFTGDAWTCINNYTATE